MNIEEFKSFIKKTEPLVADGTIDVATYRLFILNNLPEDHADEDSLFDIFSPSSVATILEQGEKIINTGHGESFILGGTPVDFGSFRDRYLEIFATWQRKNWINITKTGPNEIKAEVNQKFK
ncbi:hypothetical protein ABIE09_000521 [Lysobacter enzymogenes]|uniref:hypothetical protein n=1 Tax=Lysobacter enzymogenes TaxID=69 RepID=UPI003391FA93